MLAVAHKAAREGPLRNCLGRFPRQVRRRCLEKGAHGSEGHCSGGIYNLRFLDFALLLFGLAANSSLLQVLIPVRLFEVKTFLVNNLRLVRR